MFEAVNETWVERGDKSNQIEFDQLVKKLNTNSVEPISTEEARTFLNEKTPGRFPPEPLPPYEPVYDEKSLYMRHRSRNKWNGDWVGELSKQYPNLIFETTGWYDVTPYNAGYWNLKNGIFTQNHDKTIEIQRMLDAFGEEASALPI